MLPQNSSESLFDEATRLEDLSGVHLTFQLCRPGSVFCHFKNLDKYFFSRINRKGFFLSLAKKSPTNHDDLFKESKKVH